MRIRTLSAAVIAALMVTPVALPTAGFAQDESAKDMKGPPNASGYGKEKMGDTVVNDKTESAKDMKGSPNANGYKKDAK